MKRSVVLVLAALLLAPVLAAAKPSPAEVRNVLGYYDSGKEAVLLDVQFCSAIVDNRCSGPLDPKAIPSGREVYVWAELLVPRQTPAAAKLFYSFASQGRTFFTVDVALKESISYLVNVKFQADRAGDWTVTIEQVDQGSFTSLGKAAYTVK